MTARAPTRRAHFEVANPQAQPTREWVRCIARMLLDYADKQIAADRAVAAADEGQEHGGERE